MDKYAKRFEEEAKNIKEWGKHNDVINDIYWDLCLPFWLTLRIALHESLKLNIDD